MKPARRMQQYLKSRETVCPADELVILQEPSLPGQRKLFDEPDRQARKPQPDPQRRLF